MTDFTTKQIDRIFERDRNRCVRCGSPLLTIQHRRAKGMGGIGDDIRLTYADGIAMCSTCNAACEAELQQEALRCGWKLKRNSLVPSDQVPYYERRTGNWWQPDEFGGRHWLDPTYAAARVQIALAF